MSIKGDFSSMVIILTIKLVFLHITMGKQEEPIKNFMGSLQPILFCQSRPLLLPAQELPVSGQFL